MLVITKVKYAHPMGTFTEIDQIINVVCNHFCQNRNDIIAKRRFKEFVIPRHIIIWMATEYCPEFSLKNIGKQIGGRDHTTIIHSREFIKGQLNSKFHNDIKVWVKEITQKLSY